MPFYSLKNLDAASATLSAANTCFAKQKNGWLDQQEGGGLFSAETADTEDTAEAEEQLMTRWLRLLRNLVADAKMMDLVHPDVLYFVFPRNHHSTG